MHCGLQFSDGESELNFSGFDDDDSDDESDDSDDDSENSDESDDSDDSDESMDEEVHAYLNVYGPGWMTSEDETFEMIEHMNPWLGFPSDEDDDDDEDEDDDEDDEEVDSFIDQRSESEILAEGENLDDADVSIPYHTRENNYYTQMDSSTEHVDSENEDDDEEDKPQTPRSRRLQRSRIDTDEESEKSSDTVRGTQSSISYLRGRTTRSRARPAIQFSDED